MRTHLVTGPQGSGKTKKAQELFDKMKQQGKKPIIIDGQAASYEALEAEGYTDVIEVKQTKE